jgi:CTP:molybdopterin cytidylyltransferase MocA
MALAGRGPQPVRVAGMKKNDVVPVILAAGAGVRHLFSRGVAPAGRRSPSPARNPFEHAVSNCRGMAPAILVLGCAARRLRKYCPPQAKVVVHRAWRRGQLSSLLAGLRPVRRDRAFLLYPVDLVRLKRGVIGRLLRAFAARQRGQEIFMPRFGSRAGHPVIFAAATRSELRRAKTAREVVYADLRRLVWVPVASDAILREGKRP